MTCIQLASCFKDWAGTRAREAKSRDARTIFFSDVSLDGLAERTNRHLVKRFFKISCTGYVIQITAERLEKPTAILACFQKVLSCFSPVTKFQRVSGICLK